MQRFKWNEDIIQSLDWETFWAAIGSYEEQRPTLVKHVHGIAPTGKYAHRNCAHENPNCPACHDALETNDHVILCASPSRLSWRTQTIMRIHGSTSTDAPTDPMLVEILVAGIQRSFEDAAATLVVDRYPPAYTKLIQEQNAIGWIHLNRGRWTTE